MATITKEDIIKALEDMKITELNDLVKSIEEHFGVVAVAAAAPAAAAPAAAQTEFNLMLTNIGGNKVNVIKIVKEITELGLMEAKKLVEGTLPVLIKENLSTEKAEKAKKDLMDAGASVELK